VVGEPTVVRSGLGNVASGGDRAFSFGTGVFPSGLALTYGFDHDDAARSIARAAEIDPSCALCYWRVALTLGPNYNAPICAERVQAAWEALSAAKASSRAVSPVSRRSTHYAFCIEQNYRFLAYSAAMQRR